jgi:hypothetical protein
MHWLQTALNTYILHPLHGNGYAWWSGAGSDLSELALLGALFAAWRHHTCHRQGCWKLGHRHPQHGWPSCRKHWTETPAHIQT